MRLGHFTAFAPVCPRCRAEAGTLHTLRLATVGEAHGDDIVAGILHCPAAACAQEYPIVDGIPVIVPDVAAFLAARAAELLFRFDLDPSVESLLGDAIGPDSWFDVTRQTLSTYGWDGWADLDPAEVWTPGGPVPGSARRCLARLLGGSAPTGAIRTLDLGCGAGRTSFDLAAAAPGALVLGIDLHLGVLRLAQRALAGEVSYPRRRIGLVYDRRRFPVAPAAAERVDFWACDALALPFAPAGADLVAALNLLDCVPQPARLLGQLAAAARPGGRVLIATPYDWSTRATPLRTWVGGHSQRAPHAGAGEPFLRTLLTEGAHPDAVPGLVLDEEVEDWPWQTRLHDRAAVAYRTHLLALHRHV